jgi:hypothetical protein
MDARRTLAALAGALVVTALAATAQAYPQFQLSSGSARCNECHYSPSGTGLLNGYGRDFVGEDLSTFGGNGAFLHGAGQKIPSWLSLGGELRGAFASEDSGDINGVTNAVFPMQADAQLRAVKGVLSFYGVLGFRGQVRDSDSLIPYQNYQPISTSTLISREHYITLQGGSLGGYARLGRFFAPFGLRMAEHILYVRRDLGFGTMEETYNLSTGYLSERWEFHATAFAPDFVRQMGSRESGFTAYVEGRLADVATGALQFRAATQPGLTRQISGAVAKGWIAPIRTMLLAEGDVVRNEVDSISLPSYQFVGVGGFSVLPVKGVMGTFLYERNQVDLSVSDATYNAVTGFASWFPYAHFELQVLGRLQMPSGNHDNKTFFVQLHYFL